MKLGKILKNNKNVQLKDKKSNYINNRGNIINFYDYIERKNIWIKRNKYIKNMFVIILLLTIILNNTVFSSKLEYEGNSSYDKFLGDYRIYSRIGNEKYIYYKDKIQTNFEYYYLDKNGKEMPSYCLNLGVDGAETKDDYHVDASEKIKDQNLVALMYNGYPYKDVSELGVANVTEAKYATQFAIWAYLSNLNIEQITPVASEYIRVVNAIKTIYNGRLDTSSYTGNLINYIYSQFVDDSIDDNYYSCDFRLKYNDNVKSIKILVSGIDKYKITDLNNNEIKDFSNVKSFKILVPKNCVFETKRVKVKIEYQTRQTAILFGASKVPGMQNVSINLEPVIFENAEEDLSIRYLPLNFEILKVDKDNNNTCIPNVKFGIYDMQDNLLGEYITDENGRISFDIFKELGIKSGQKIKVKELSVPDGYYIDEKNNTKIIEVFPRTIEQIVFENEKIKGKVKIIKTSSDYNFFNNLNEGSLLKDAVFGIYDSNNKLLQEITTNEKGEAISKDLFKGKYYIKEKSSPKHYILDDKIYEFEIKEHNKIVTLNMKNESEKRIELPKTGF